MFKLLTIWQAGPAKFILAATLANIILYHIPLLSFALNNLDYLSVTGVQTLFTLIVVVFLLSSLGLTLIYMVSHHLIKPFCALVAIVNSFALYFVVNYQIVLDRSMMGNILNTNISEAVDLFHPRLLVYVFLFGLMPCLFLLSVGIQRSRRSQLLFYQSIVVFISIGWIYFSSSSWLWIDKNAKKLGGMVLPWSYTINLTRFQLGKIRQSQEQVQLPPAQFNSQYKTVVILVIGEAARAKNFSLYGYNRLTNPLLKQSSTIALSKAVSCSTYTTASLQCILSHTNERTAFSRNYEPLPSYLQRQGVDVIWRTNNWGEPPITVQEYQRAGELREHCVGGHRCQYDEVLLSNLGQRIASSSKQRIFVVLHQTGSHGPSYYSKYPEEFEVFKPVCRSVELQKCTQEELINAYDNTILYTDYFLNRVVDVLKGMKNTASMFMYISDHGESLGEYGLYLHGTPYSIAPDVQKTVPFLVWMSDEFIEHKGASNTRLNKEASHSQEFVFHSIMGAFDMHSDIYNSNLDIFSESPLKAN